MNLRRAMMWAGVRLVEQLGWSPSIELRAGIGKGLKLGLAEALRGGFRHGDYETPVQETLKEHLRSGAVVADVGANVGFFTLIAARLVGPEGHVYAIEPVPTNARALRRNIERNGLPNCTVIEAGAGRETGRAKLLLARHPGGATLSERDTPPDLSGELEIEMIRLDDLLQSTHGQRLAFVKIDVEGFEVEVLEGMSQILACDAPDLLIEIDAPTEDALAGKRTQVEEALASRGYGVRPLPASYAAGNWAVEHLLASRAQGPTSATNT
jgi:FkbM family methyltransferase